MNTKFSDGVSNTPVITLRKGNVVLKIPNATAVLQKIEEMYPDTKFADWRIKKDSNAEDKNRQRRWMSAAQNWFRQEVFGGVGDFEVVVEENSHLPVSYDESKHIVKTPFGEFTPECIEDLAGVTKRVVPQFDLSKTTKEPETIKTTNKNAYELRCLILEYSINVVNKYGNEKSLDETVAVIMDTCNKFYRFVENKK